MRNEFKVTKCEYAFADIYIAGDHMMARFFCQEYCMIGLCVSVFDCDYVYTGGKESGVLVRLINYARFPTNQVELTELAKDLAFFLVLKLHQSSASVVSPCGSFWISRRD